MHVCTHELIVSNDLCVLLLHFVTPRMRELNLDGTVKDVSCLMSELGFSLGSYAERKADKSRGKIISISEIEVKLEIMSAPGVVASVPIKMFLDSQWVRFAPKPEKTSVSVIPQPIMNDEFEAIRLSGLISQKMCDLVISHDATARKLSVQLSPSKQVVAQSSFEKGKLVLVPACAKVSYAFQQDRSNESRVIVQVRKSSAIFTLVPFRNAAKDDGCVAPFWFTAASSEEFNMEMTVVKSSDGDICLPVARNIKPIKQGDSLVLFKKKRVADPLVVETQSGSSKPPAPKKKSRTS